MSLVEGNILMGEVGGAHLQSRKTEWLKQGHSAQIRFGKMGKSTCLEYSVSEDGTFNLELICE